MLDDLRGQSGSAPFYDDEGDSFQLPAAGARQPGRFLGMTAPQRFVIAVMLMIAVCTLGSMCLLVTGKIGI